MDDLPKLLAQSKTIVADPPWTQQGGPLCGDEGAGFAVEGTRPSRPLPYDTMSVDEICAMPVAEHARADAHLYLWATNRSLPDAFRVAQAWGFTYSTTLVWAKATMGGGLGGAYGISTEFCLFCRRGKLPARERVAGTWFDWKRPYDHRGKPRSSAKPADFFHMVMEVSPGPYLEVFARDRRDGWAGWGLEFDPEQPCQREMSVELAVRGLPAALGVRPVGQDGSMELRL